jgi:hypothetical protein
MQALSKTCGRFFVTVVLSTLALSTGCQQSLHADHRLDQRLEKLRGTANAVAKGEAIRPAKLAEMGRRIDHETRSDAAKFERDLREAHRLAALDIRRWNERQPLYRKSIAREFWGKPQNIETVFIDLFY